MNTQQAKIIVRERLAPLSQEHIDNLVHHAKRETAIGLGDIRDHWVSPSGVC